MTREAFIRKWLCTEKPYTEPFRDEMREDLDKVINYSIGFQSMLYSAEDMDSFAEWIRVRYKPDVLRIWIRKIAGKPLEIKTTVQLREMWKDWKLAQEKKEESKC